MYVKHLGGIETLGIGWTIGCSGNGNSSHSRGHVTDERCWLRTEKRRIVSGISRTTLRVLGKIRNCRILKFHFIGNFPGATYSSYVLYYFIIVLEQMQYFKLDCAFAYWIWTFSMISCKYGFLKWAKTGWKRGWVLIFVAYEILTFLASRSVSICLYFCGCDAGVKIWNIYFCGLLFLVWLWNE